MSDCVDRERLERMLADRLDDGERQGVEDHVEDCPACHRILDELTRSLDPAPDPDPDPEPIEDSTESGFLDRIKRIGLPGMEPEREPTSSHSPDGEGSYLPSIAGFQMIRELGRGGMGTVYEAIELALDRRVALKVLPRSAVLSSATIERFRRESRATAQLHHTNIVPVFGVGEDAAYFYHALQFIDGEALDRLVARVRAERDGQHLPSSEPVAPRPDRPKAWCLLKNLTESWRDRKR